MQVSLVGFMDKYGAAAFMDALWKLLLSAQKTVGGVPVEVHFLSLFSSTERINANHFFV